MILSLVVCALPDHPLEMTTFSTSPTTDLELLLETTSPLEPFELSRNPSLEHFDDLQFWITILFESEIVVLVYPSPIQSIADDDTVSSSPVHFMISGEYE